MQKKKLTFDSISIYNGAHLDPPRLTFWRRDAWRRARDELLSILMHPPRRERRVGMKAKGRDRESNPAAAAAAAQLLPKVILIITHILRADAPQEERRSFFLSTSITIASMRAC